MASAFFILAAIPLFAVAAIAMFVRWAAAGHASLETQARCRQMAAAAFAGCVVCSFLAWWNW